MLISVFLSLVSCHLGSLTIVSVSHILLLQLALSVQREKREMDRQKTEEHGGKSEEHTRHTAALGCQRQTGREKYKERRKSGLKSCKHLPCEGSLCAVPI